MSTFFGFGECTYVSCFNVMNVDRVVADNIEHGSYLLGSGSGNLLRPMPLPGQGPGTWRKEDGYTQRCEGVVVLMAANWTPATEVPPCLESKRKM